ncbi:cysteine desulfurase NifS [Alicyclobacillus cellulosilyticus]|uniref:cysteine desulfurase n=1 Tax=Alicyclobacillus cellulosilyticus TaxID=1003997 RepID=A0A917NLD6_9BACL|nr:cysteine desulfurase family protein [Alicyclobacillus cellulosilyticus]GGJ06394.1 cysteine desulfurase NifS [Alicyclobacillus cellulosilyticus]
MGAGVIYLDNAATTPMADEVWAAMAAVAAEYGNPSSLHARGRDARAVVETARRQVAAFIGAAPGDVVFTSGGTEANHLALFGAWLAAGADGRVRRHVVTTAVEHHSVLEPCRALRQFGAEVTFVRPRPDGTLAVADVVSALRPDTLCVSVMAVNNETGAVYPVSDIAAAVKQADSQVVVHCDMVQALGVVPVRVEDTGIDLATFSAHKIHGPKGVGALYVRRGTRWQPVLRGGAQERGRRAGTENVLGIAGFGAACARLARIGMEEHTRHLAEVRAAFWQPVSRLPGVRVNSPPDGSPAILNVAFRGVRNDILLMRLDLEGVLASAGSACTAGSLEPSHVLLACGQAEEEAREAVRFSFSGMTTVDEARAAGELVVRVVSRLRRA